MSFVYTGPELAKLLSFSNAAAQAAVAEVQDTKQELANKSLRPHSLTALLCLQAAGRAAQNSNWDPRSVVGGQLQRANVAHKPWLSLITLHCQAFAARGQAKHIEAYARLTDAWPHMSAVRSLARNLYSLRL